MNEEMTLKVNGEFDVIKLAVSDILNHRMRIFRGCLQGCCMEPALPALGFGLYRNPRMG
jgi:hypothetical protein